MIEMNADTNRSGVCRTLNSPVTRQGQMLSSHNMRTNEPTVFFLKIKFY